VEGHGQLGRSGQLYVRGGAARAGAHEVDNGDAGATMRNTRRA